MAFALTIRKCVKVFSKFTSPLTYLTKKGAFSWSKEAKKAFKKMKEVMISFLVLTLPYFTQPFVLECDALGEVIGVVFMQNKHPIYYERRKLQLHERHHSIYYKDM